MKKIIALAVAAVVAAPAMADLTIGAAARYQIDNGTYSAAVAEVPSTATTAGGSTGTAAAAASNADTRAATNRVQVSFAGSTTAENGMFVSAAATVELSGASGVARDGDNAITIGNEMANVVLGAFEPAGAFNSGTDAFEQSAISSTNMEGPLRARESTNFGINVTAVEGLTLQFSSDVDSMDSYRLVAGYDFGAFKATAAHSNVDGADNQNSITVGTTLGGVGLNVSHGAWGDAKSTNVNASYMGFSLAVQNDETAAGAEEQEVYGAYAVANAAGLEGLTVTVGAGTTDTKNVAGVEPDTRYGVRLDYAF